MTLAIIDFVLLVAVSAFCKAAMDTRVFQDKTLAYQSYPAWFRAWMQRRGTIPVVKIDDGWHAMQMVMFAALGAAYIIAGTMWPVLGWWVLLSIPLRAVVHGLVFEIVYPML